MKCKVHVATHIFFRCRGIYIQGNSSATVEIKTIVWLIYPVCLQWFHQYCIIWFYPLLILWLQCKVTPVKSFYTFCLWDSLFGICCKSHATAGEGRDKRFLPKSLWNSYSCLDDAEMWNHNYFAKYLWISSFREKLGQKQC